MPENVAEGPARLGPSPLQPVRTAKIVLIGSSTTGKTSLRNRYFKGHKGFSQAYIATIGADFVTKKVDLDDGAQSVSVQLWDTAGQERFQALGAAFYRGADACILVYACDSPDSLGKVESWYHSFIDRCPVPDGQEKTFPFICIGNKHDLVHASRPTSKTVKQDEAEALLRRLCPPIEAHKTVNKTVQPSAVSMAPDLRDARRQQDRELIGRSSQSPSKKRRGSSTSANRRSLEILPDQAGRTNSRGPSVYHTPSSSLAHPSWANATKTSSLSSSLKTGTDFVGPDYTSDGIPPAPPGHEDAIAEEAGEETEDHAQGSTDEQGSPADTVFGAQDGIKHFLASAKTGEGVDDAFDYLVKRIGARWKWQEESAYLGPEFGDEPSNIHKGGPRDSIRVGHGAGGSDERKGWRSRCC